MRGRLVPELDAFLEELSSAAPVPGGGSAAAVAVAMGAALLVMVCNLTLGRARYADVQTETESIAAQAAALRDRARSLAREDELAYGRVAEAMGLPRDSEDETERRRARVQAALKQAAEPPLETMRVAAAVVELANRLAPIGNRSAVSDVGTAGFLAAAGFGAARLNVDINLAAVTDPRWVEETRDALERVPDAHAANRTTQRLVARAMGAQA